MNNRLVESTILDGIKEIYEIESIIKRYGSLSNISKFLAGYTLILTCGILEYSFKNIISDVHSNVSPQIQNYITKKIKNSSQNPNYNNMCTLLGDFDDQWKKQFSTAINSLNTSSKLFASLQSLNNNRNEFAHGKKRAFSFNDIVNYFYDSLDFILIMDSIVK